MSRRNNYQLDQYFVRKVGHVPTNKHQPPSLTFDQYQLTQSEIAIVSLLHSSKFQLIKTLSITTLTECFTCLFRSKRGKWQESNKLLRFTLQSTFFQCMYLSQNAFNQTPHLPFLVLSQQVKFSVHSLETFWAKTKKIKMCMFYVKI